jgi:hypothetical protein
MSLDQSNLNSLISYEFLGAIWIPRSEPINLQAPFYELDHLFDGLLSEKMAVLDEGNRALNDFYLTYLYDQSFFLLVTQSEEKIISHLKSILLKDQVERNKIVVINSKQNELNLKKLQTVHTKLEFVFYQSEN